MICWYLYKSTRDFGSFMGISLDSCNSFSSIRQFSVTVLERYEILPSPYSNAVKKTQLSSPFFTERHQRMIINSSTFSGDRQFVSVEFLVGLGRGGAVKSKKIALSGSNLTKPTVFGCYSVVPTYRVVLLMSIVFKKLLTSVFALFVYFIS